jgi:hypothetical protein
MCNALCRVHKILCAFCPPHMAMVLRYPDDPVLYFIKYQESPMHLHPTLFKRVYTSLYHPCSVTSVHIQNISRIYQVYGAYTVAKVIDDRLSLEYFCNKDEGNK